MVLNLIARAAGQSDSAGPYVREDGRVIAIRDWLSDALMPMAQRDARRVAVVNQVRVELARKGVLPADEAQAEEMIAEEVRARLRHSGRTNVSRAVSDLVRAGLVRRHYQGYRVDHENRGAQREAVYTITPRVRRALGRVA
jgi:DNA-binding transcriptional ArsR family regulator